MADGNDAGGGDSSAAKGGATTNAGGDELPTIKRRTNKDLDSPIICKVWKRPVFLQYCYLYDYRHNYYDDVIDYLDRRQRGISREIPRPQTWAERALRTYCYKVKSSAAYEGRIKQISLLSDIRTSARLYDYHNKEWYSKY